jgi:hypothetical protein
MWKYWIHFYQLSTHEILEGSPYIVRLLQTPPTPHPPVKPFRCDLDRGLACDTETSFVIRDAVIFILKGKGEKVKLSLCFN